MTNAPAVTGSDLPIDDVCPCGTGVPYTDCCQPRLAGIAAAPTAEALMRSRYTAFVLGNAAYLGATWHSSTRPADPSPPRGLSWRRLRIRDVVDGGAKDLTGEVEFIAHYRTQDGKREFLHERSRFVADNGRWFYVDGKLF